MNDFLKVIHNFSNCYCRWFYCLLARSLISHSSVECKIQPHEFFFFFFISTHSSLIDSWLLYWAFFGEFFFTCGETRRFPNLASCKERTCKYSNIFQVTNYIINNNIINTTTKKKSFKPTSRLWFLISCYWLSSQALCIMNNSFRHCMHNYWLIMNINLK